jgi:hypothetical protein
MNKTIVVVALIAVALLFAFNSKSESFVFGLDGKGVRNSYLCPVEQTYNAVTSKCEDKPNFIGRPPVPTLD